MPRKTKLIPYLLLLAGIAGGLAIVVATRDAIYRPNVSSEPTVAPSQVTTQAVASQPPTTAPPSSSSQGPIHTTAAPPPTLTPTPRPTITPPPTPTPTPAPIAISPPLVSATGALAYMERDILIVLRPDEAKVTMIADGLSQSAQPILWSPDGQYLLYTTNKDTSEDDATGRRRTIHLWDSRLGEARQVAPHIPGFPSGVPGVQEVIWSPKGTRILLRYATEEAAPQTWVLDVNTTDTWRLPGASITSAAWVDEDTLLCQRSEGNASQFLSVGPPAQILTDTVQLSGFYALSPDRDYVASFKGQPGTGQRLHILSLPHQAQAGSVAQPSVAPDRLSLSHQPTVTVSGPDLLWSPDGRWVAYGADMVNSNSAGGPYTLLADTLGLGETQSFPHLRPVAWSPDSRLLAGFGCSNGECRLSLVDVESAQVSSLVAASDLRLWDLAWSPHGVYLVYSVSGLNAGRGGLVLWNRGSGEHLPLMEASETSEAERLQPFTDLQWSADAYTFYAAQREKQSDDLMVSAIWGFGPTWEDPWTVAPGFSQNRTSFEEALQHRQRNPGISAPAPLLDDRRLIAYYGTPLGRGLGILGRHTIPETLRLLKDQTQVYRDLDPSVDTIPAFHMVTTIADDFPGSDGDYNHRVPHETIRPWIEAIEAEGGWSILDVQPGRANLIDELDAIEPLLFEPKVHLAVDPEFIVAGDQVPGKDLGRIAGFQINQIQARLDRVARETGQRKILVIHQFDDRMIYQKEMILDYPLVDLVWDADGFGGPGSKIKDYDQYKTETGFEHGGFKIFYVYDQPLVTPQEVLALQPPPSLVIYQ